jgi:hypothetical protein
MSISLPSHALSGTAPTASPSTELAAFWTVTGVVALAVASGAYEVIVHFMG